MANDEAYLGQFNANMAGQQAQCARAMHPHESAAVEWRDAKTRLMEALEASNKASAELQDAHQGEQVAWEKMEGSAGRGPVPALAPVIGPPMHRR